MTRQKLCLKRGVTRQKLCLKMGVKRQKLCQKYYVPRRRSVKVSLSCLSGELGGGREVALVEEEDCLLLGQKRRMVAVGDRKSVFFVRDFVVLQCNCWVRSAQCIHHPPSIRALQFIIIMILPYSLFFAARNKVIINGFFFFLNPRSLNASLLPLVCCWCSGEP